MISKRPNTILQPTFSALKKQKVSVSPVKRTIDQSKSNPLKIQTLYIKADKTPSKPSPVK
jgi:hypothetical protein